jgi:hypothetical protein
MAVQDPEYLDKLFVQDVAELERLGRQTPRDNYSVLQMSAVIRRLFCDEQCLAQHASKRLGMPLIFLVPEPIAGNPAYDPKRTFHPLVLKYAPEISERTHPFGREGFFHAPYDMIEYLERPHMVLPHKGQGRAIRPRELVKFFANKMGGVHADKNLVDDSKLDAETLHTINESVSIFGQPALFQQFGHIADAAWRCAAPLRDAYEECKRT